MALHDFALSLCDTHVDATGTAMTWYIRSLPSLADKLLQKFQFFTSFAAGESEWSFRVASRVCSTQSEYLEEWHFSFAFFTFGAGTDRGHDDERQTTQPDQSMQCSKSHGWSSVGTSRRCWWKFWETRRDLPDSRRRTFGRRTNGPRRARED